ncbi:hypothetical protein Tco_1244428 [Tanacetum coccineum]
MLSPTVTYTSVYSDSEPWRFQWVSDDEPAAPVEAPQPLEQESPSSDYVPGPEHPPSPNYVPGPVHSPLPDYILGLEYPEYLVLADDEAPIEDQPLSADASPTALSLGYVADSDHEEDLEESAGYPDEEEDSEDENEEEEEHLALTNSTTLPVVDLVPSSEDTEAFETVDSLLPHHHHLDSHGLGYLSDPRPTNIPSPPLPLTSPPYHYHPPTDAEALWAIRAAMISGECCIHTKHTSILRIPSPPLLLPSTIIEMIFPRQT